MISRRALLKGFLAFSAGSAGLGGYAIAEPFRLRVTRHAVNPPGWPSGLKLRLAVLADMHICEPWMGLARLQRVVARTNALQPDAVLLLGDYIPSHGMMRWSNTVRHGEWVTVLSGLRSPLGTHAVLGNHDWWDDLEVQRRRKGPTPAGLALEAEGIPVYENDAVRLEKDAQPFWLAGLGDQWAFWPDGPHGKWDYIGVDDLDGTMAKVTDDAPVVLMAHEPDIFPQVPDRVAVTISGHTHGGQVRLFGYAPVVPSKFGRRYVYGHIVEAQRNLVVSAGLGCSGLPVRFGMPPEIALIELGTASS